MLTVKYFPADPEIHADPFLAIETPTTLPRGKDEPLLVDDIDTVRKLIADLQAVVAKWEAA